MPDARSIMSRGSRLLSVTLALLCVTASALVVASQTEPSATALAAEDCLPARGDLTLPGDALLHVPARVRTPMALVIAFHGAGGTGSGMARYSGLSATADRYGFAVLYPTAATR